MKRPLIIGITGGIGGGKSVFSACLRDKGLLVYNSDIEARRLQNESEYLREKIMDTFGHDIYNDGILDRGKLASIVFSSTDKLKKLNELVHPAVLADFEAWVAKHQDKELLFLESAILFEAELTDIIDKVIVVTAPKDIRINRVMKRDGVPKECVCARMKNQMPEEQKIKLADWVCDTNDDLEPHHRVEEFLKKLYK